MYNGSAVLPSLLFLLYTRPNARDYENKDEMLKL